MENRVYQEVNSLVHDLKTPLVTIRGLNSLLFSERGNSKQEEYCERIESSVTKMSEMISGFLYEYSRQKLKAEDLVNYIRAQLPLEDEKVRFSISIEQGLQDIYINKIRIARAVINILENAIVAPCVYPYKLIDFDVKSADKGINIIIRDNGVGIEKANLIKIWEVGYSTNNTSGLGLPFAKRIIEDNAGTIEIMSQHDSGTTVTIYLPSYECIENLEGVIQLTRNNRLEIVIIDDEPDILYTIEEICKYGRWEAATAPNGRQGYELCKVHHPNLAIVDYHMPDWDGLSTVKKNQAIRQCNIDTSADSR